MVVEYLFIEDLHAAPHVQGKQYRYFDSNRDLQTIRTLGTRQGYELVNKLVHRNKQQWKTLKEKERTDRQRK